MKNKYNIKKIMHKAWEIYKDTGCTTRAEFAIALKMSWTIAKDEVKEVKEEIIASFDFYNARRYSTPWVAVYKNGKYEFGAGKYSAPYNSGDAGELHVDAPIEGTMYAYGQKDYRKSNTMLRFAIYKNGQFVECDRYGKVSA